MPDSTKNLIEVILHVFTLLGALVAFWVGIYQWKKAQRWQRAAALDKFVERWETNELLQLAATVVDWTDRRVEHSGKAVVIRNDEVLLALRDHENMPAPVHFPGKQPLLRDALDTVLQFFGRLELAISSGLIDADPARQYFGYWLEHLLLLDRHPDINNVFNGQATPSQMMRRYVDKYGDLQSILRLQKTFRLTQ